MARFYGKIGFVETTETSPGVYSEKPIERSYRGEVINNVRRWETKTDGINENFTISNSISIISDDFAVDHAPYIRYVEWMGSYWNVSSIEIKRPRLILSLGGVYNKQDDDSEEENTAPDDSGEYSGE